MTEQQRARKVFRQLKAAQHKSVAPVSQPIRIHGKKIVEPASRPVRIKIKLKDSNTGFHTAIPESALATPSIKMLRKSKQMTQEQLAYAAGVKLSTLQKIERYETLPLGTSIEVGAKLARALDTKLEHLIVLDCKKSGL